MALFEHGGGIDAVVKQVLKNFCAGHFSIALDGVAGKTNADGYFPQNHCSSLLG